jgi:arsenite methyltransferase
LQTPSQDELIREEFNRWAQAGRGGEMEDHHRPITDPTLDLMRLQPSDVVLDLGCGTGWLSRQIAAQVPRGSLVGIDVSNEMIEQAKRASAQSPNLTFRIGTADQIPWESAFFTQAISVESAYYWPDPASGLRELFRVLRPGGSAWILINFYRDNPHCLQWAEALKVSVRLLSTEEWKALFHAAGFTQIENRRIPDPTPTPDVYTGRWFRDADQMRKFKAEGALLIRGVK